MLEDLRELNKLYSMPYFGIKHFQEKNLKWEFVKIVGRGEVKTVDWFRTREQIAAHIQSLLAYEREYRP